MTDDLASDTAQLREVIQNRYTAAREHASKWREEARAAFDMYAGKQWKPEDERILTEQQRVPVTFNRSAVLIDAVVGYETNNRQETKYIPRTQGDAKVNELLTEAANYFRDQCDAEFEESDAFRDMLISGMGWTLDRLSDERNPEFDLVRDRVDPLRMLWDPSSRKPNLDDSRYFIHEADCTKQEAKALVPEWDGEFKPADWLVGPEDGEPGRTDPRNWYKDDNEASARRNIRVLEYQWIEDATEHVISVPQTGETLAIDDQRWQEMEEQAREKLAPFHASRRVRQWRKAFVIGSDIFVKPHSYAKGSTFHCITGKRDRNSGHWFGLMRSLRDPQMWSNKWLSQLMHLINTSAKPGYDIEKGAVDNVKAFESNAARPGAVNTFVDGALQQGRIQRREAVGLPPDLANLLKYANDSMSDVSGINQELLGMADREQAGVLEYQRKQSAVTLLAPLFDSFRRYRKIAGRSWLHHMREYMADGRLIRITQDDGKQAHLPFQKGQVQNPAQGDMTETGQVQSPIVQFFDEAAHEYDVIVDQSSSSPNLKEATWGALQPLFPILGERMGPEEIMLALEYSPIPESFVEKLRQINAAKAQQPPPPDPEMMKVQAQLQLKQAEMQMKAQDAERSAALEVHKANEKLRMEKAAAEQKMMLDAMQAQHEMQLAEQKMQHDLRLKAMAANVQMEVAAQNVSAENERADFKAASDARRMDKLAAAKAKAAKTSKPEARA